MNVLVGVRDDQHYHDWFLRAGARRARVNDMGARRARVNDVEKGGKR